MTLTNSEFEGILADPSKTIEADIAWSPDEDHSPAVEFRAEVKSDAGWPLFVRGSYNSLAQALTFAIIHKGVGRIYGLDVGKDHHNPQCDRVGEIHKHRWTEQFRDKEAYVPTDITAGVGKPVEVWRQFCMEASITHAGGMIEPSPPQGDLFI